MFFRHIAIAAFAAGVLASCSGTGTDGSGITVVQETPAYETRGVGARRAEGSLLQGSNSLRSVLTGSGSKDENTLPVNKYLWRASLDVLGFLPLASTDTFSGVIATDWGAVPEAPNERVRATAYVRSAELSAQALDVTVYREVLGATGAWQAAPVDPNTAEQLEDAILTRARQLRIEDVDAG